MTTYNVKSRIVRIPAIDGNHIPVSEWKVEAGPMSHEDAERLCLRLLEEERVERHEEEMRHVDASGVPMPILFSEGYQSTQYVVSRAQP